MRFIPAAAGMIMAMLGVTVMLAWINHWQTLIQVYPTFVPMQFNTGLCFFLLGLGLFRTDGRQSSQWFSVVCAGLSVLLAGLTGAQYLTGMDLGVDRLFIEPYLTVHLTYPGRMAPNTAFCLCCLSLTLILLNCMRRTVVRLGIVLMLNIVVMLLSINALIGYILELKADYSWWGGSKLALHTAFGLLIGASGMLVLARQLHRNIESGFGGAWRLALTASIGIALTVLASQTILLGLKNQAEKSADNELRRTEYVIALDLKSDVSALKRIQARWASGDTATTESWARDVNNYTNDNPAYAAFVLLDSNYNIIKKVASEENILNKKDIENLFVYSRPQNAQFVSKLDMKPSYMIWGFPMIAAGKAEMFMVVAYDINEKLNSFRNQEQDKPLFFEIKNEDGSVYSSGKKPDYAWKIERDSQLDFIGKSWTLYQIISPSMFQNSNLVLLVLLAGSCLSLLLAYAMWQNGKVLSLAENLRLSDERYSYALESSKVALWDWDPIADRTIWGGNAWEILGVESNERLNETQNFIRQLIPAENYLSLTAGAQKALEARESFSLDFLLTRPDGQEIWVQATGRAVAFKDGKPVRAAGTLIDITSRMRMEKEAELYRVRLEAILDNIVDGLVTIDENGIVQSYNKSCERIFGYRAEEVVGNNVSMLMPQMHAMQHNQYLKNYLTTGKAKIIGIGRELEGRRKDGTIFPMDLSVASVRVGQQRFFSGIVRDITARKIAEDELKQSNQELEKFAYVASHDLKAPLRNIDNLAKWVIEDMEGQMPADAQKKMELLRGRVLGLETLLEDILSYSRAGRITEPPVPVEVQDLVAMIIQTHVPDGFSVNIKEKLPRIISPRTPLEQVFSNLISNAVKHHDRKEGVIEISAKLRDEFYEFSVTDNGPGIPPQFYDRVFQMFQTLQSRDKVSGSGLGMSIVKKLVEWQGGRIWIESAPAGRGTSIHFMWPAVAHATLTLNKN